MSRADVIVKKLEGLSEKLAERGQSDLVSEVDDVVSALRRDAAANQPTEVMTTGEAAALLGVRSVFTV